MKHDVFGIDVSRGTIEVCKLRGLDNVRQIAVLDFSPELVIFDTVLFFGNDFGFAGVRKNTVTMLKKLHAITSPNAIILASSRDPKATDKAVHFAYHKRNLERDGILVGSELGCDFKILSVNSLICYWSVLKI